MSNYKLHLASQSPRRRELLEKAGFEIQVDSVKVSEIIDENLNLTAAIEQLALLKARTFVETHKYLRLGNNLILSADTLVSLGERPLGKPKNFKEACEFLGLLSGKTHSVITGFCFLEADTERFVLGHDETLVEFLPLTKEEIEAYVHTGEPMDKAGAYAIQGEGEKFVKSYKGSWTNVVGLPMEKLEKVIASNAWSLVRRKSS